MPRYRDGITDRLRPPKRLAEDLREVIGGRRAGGEDEKALLLFGARHQRGEVRLGVA